MSAFVQHRGFSIHPQRQTEPHPHSIHLDANNRFAFVPDLGLDLLLIYRFESAQGTFVKDDVSRVALTPGAGPRHLAFHPNGRYVYLTNELNATLTIFGYNVDSGLLKPLQTISILPRSGWPIGRLLRSYRAKRSRAAEVRVAPSGQFVYVSNRGYDDIAVFHVDSIMGTVTAAGHDGPHGRMPRHFGIDPTGTYLLAANQQSDSVVVFRIDPVTGGLRPTGHVGRVPRPSCVTFSAPPGAMGI